MKNGPLAIIAALALVLFGLAIFCSVKILKNYSTVQNCYWAGQAATENRDWKNAISNYTEIIRRKPREARAYVSRAYAYHWQGDFDKAIRDYTEAIRLNPADGYSFQSRALAYGSNGQFDKAIADLSEAIRLDPNHADNYKFRSQSYANRKEWDKALRDIQTAIGFDANDPTNYVARAISYTGKGDWEKASDDYAKAIQLDPTMPSAYLNRAHLYLAQNQTEQALADLRRATQLDSKDAVACNGLAWMLATCPEAKVRNGKEAVDLARKACELSEWKQSHCVDTLAAAYAEAGDFEQAVKFQQQVISMEKIEEFRAGEEERLTLYEQHKPYREKPSAPLSQPSP